MPGGDANTGVLLTEALDGVDPGVDFGQFDNDGPDGNPNSGDDDGLVDFVAFVHPETGSECAPTTSTNMWSHAWFYRRWPAAGNQPYTTNDARNGGGFIEIDQYNIMPALNCAGGTIEIGVFAHEFGHAFGIPDLYDTEDPSDSEGLGHWSLMAGGNWNTPTSPAHWDAWSKSEVGWLTPTLLTSLTNGLQINQVETNPEAFQISTGSGRYLLIENRQAVGFDQNLKSCGLLIYDVDEQAIASKIGSNSVNNVQNCSTFQQNAPDHYGIALEQADAQCDLEADNNRGDAGDPFPGSSSNTTFNSTSNPSVIDYFGNDPNVSVANISNCSAVMTADIQAFPLPDFDPGAVDVVFLIDVTGSYADDLPNIQAQMPGIVTQLTTAFADIRFGLATFRDFPFSPFGGTADVAYDPVLPLQNDTATFLNAVNGLAGTGGADLPESQYEVLFQVLTGNGRDLTGDGDTDDAGEIDSSDIGWTAGRSRVLYLLTDASFHDSDTENYPGTLLEAAGRNDVLPLLQPNDPVIFTMVAEHPGIFVTQGETGESPPLPTSELVKQAAELASDTLGGVFPAGVNSINLTEVIDVTIESLEETAGARPVSRLDIDIKPESDVNSINPKSGGVIPVAILGSATFDVTDIDVATLKFGPDETETKHSLTDPSTLATHLQDVNLDGRTDLILHFRAKETGIVDGDTEACLVAETQDPALLVGCDTVRTSPRT